MPPRNQLVACVIRQYDAEPYRAWVSLDKGHMVCLGEYQDEADATETIDRFLDTYRDGRIKTPEDILPLIDSSRLNGDDVYVTQVSVQQAQAAIESDHVGLRGIKDLQLAGDIEIEVSEIGSAENRIESRGRVVEHSLSM